jgi:hypothetical protein
VLARVAVAVPVLEELGDGARGLLVEADAARDVGARSQRMRSSSSTPPWVIAITARRWRARSRSGAPARRCAAGSPALCGVGRRRSGGLSRLTCWSSLPKVVAIVAAVVEQPASFSSSA